MAVPPNVVGVCCIPTTTLTDFSVGQATFAAECTSDSAKDGMARRAGRLIESPPARGHPQRKRPQRSPAAALKRDPLTGTRSAICRHLGWKTTGSTKSRWPNVPMTVRDLMQPDWEPPNSVPPGAASEPAWAREPAPAPALVQPSAPQAWVREAWVREPWVREPWVREAWLPGPPSFLLPPSWLTSSALPPSTSWRISSRTSWPFSPTSWPTSSKISSRIFSSLSQHFSYPF
jgi:hypothetical protein